LRRTKDIIKDQLTKKYDEVVFCPLTDVQMEVYKRILGMEAVQNMIKKDDQCDCGKGKKYCKFWLASVRLLTAMTPGGRSAAIRSTREIYSSTCPR
jgi:SNF2 family DNA or RNA helicase